MTLIGRAVVICAGALVGALASFLLGYPTAGQFDINTFRTNQAKYYALFLQDDVRVRRLAHRSAARPPAAHAAGEDLERARRRRLGVDRPSDRGDRH